MKKFFSIFCALILSCTALATIASAQTLGMPNPFTTCQTLSEASSIAKFSLTVPDTWGDYQQDTIQATKSNPTMIQVSYRKDSSPSDTLLIRKARGFQSRLDGNYHSYKITQYRILNHRLVKMRMDGIPKDNTRNYGIHVINYYCHGYSYSISSDLGLSVNQVESLLTQIH